MNKLLNPTYSNADREKVSETDTTGQTYTLCVVYTHGKRSVTVKCILYYVCSVRGSTVLAPVVRSRTQRTKRSVTQTQHRAAPRKLALMHQPSLFPCWRGNYRIQPRGGHGGTKRIRSLTTRNVAAQVLPLPFLSNLSFKQPKDLWARRPMARIEGE